MYTTARHLAALGQIGDHLANMGGQPGPLGDDGGVEIADPEAARLRQADHMFKQQHAVDPLVGGVGVGEIAADVAEAESAENRITNRMQQNIRVRMTEQAIFIRDRHAAEDQRPVGNQAMDIKTVADTHHVKLTSPAVSNALARARSAGVVILILWGCPVKTATGQPHHSISEASSVPT